MPAAGEAAPTPTARHLTDTLTQEEQADIAAINATIDRMRTFTAPDPYILTIPQDVERYRHAYQYQAMQWLLHAPFQWREGEAMQYQTFMYHEHGKDMYVLQNSRPSETLQPATDQPKAGTGKSTPIGAKKKISLDAYKKKQTGAGGTPAQDAATPAAKAEVPAKPTAVKGPAERARAETETMLAAIAEDEIRGQDSTERKELKRRRKDSREPDEMRSETLAAGQARATKRARTASPPPQLEARVPEAASKSIEGTTHHAKDSARPTQRPSHSVKSQAHSPNKPVRAPQRPRTPPASLEDTALPPKLSPLGVPSLPSRLSPTIPPNIADVLQAREDVRSSSSSDNSISALATESGKLTPSKKLDGITKHKSSVPRNAFRTNSSSPGLRSDLEGKLQPTRSTAPAPPRPEASEPAEDKEKGTVKGLKAKMEAESTLIVKMKYKKHQKEGIRRLLNMRPAPDKIVTPPPAATPISCIDELSVGGKHLGSIKNEGLEGQSDDEQSEEQSKAKKTAIVRKRDPTAKGVAQKVGPTTGGVAKRKPESNQAAAGKRPASTDVESKEPPAVHKPALQGAVAKKVEELEKVLGSEKRPPPKESDGSKSVPAKRKLAREESSAPEAATTSPPSKRAKSSNAPAKESPELPRKRRKAPDAIEAHREPSTPVQPALLSPAVITSMQRGQPITPNVRKDHVSSAMQRETTADSNVNTPSVKSNSTPVTNGHAAAQMNGLAKLPSSQLSNKTPKQQAWETEQRRLEILGRELKHAATAHLKPLLPTPAAKPVSQTSEQKLAAVKSIESLLAYILAFTCADEAALAADPKQNPTIKTWRSLLGFFLFVKRNCEAFPPLLGLACQLGVVFHARILDLTLQSSLPPPTTERAPGRDVVLDTYAALSKYASDADANLDVDALQHSFPRTWRQRLKGPLPAASDKLTGPGDLVGEYKLPIGVATPPIRAVRAGFAMLEEWVAGERVEYVMKLKL